MCTQGTPLQAEAELEVTTHEVPTEERRCTLLFSVPHLAKQHMKQDIYIQEEHLKNMKPKKPLRITFGELTCFPLVPSALFISSATDDNQFLSLCTLNRSRPVCFGVC